MGKKLFDQGARNKAIESLIRIRLSGYHITKVNALSEDDNLAIRTLCMELGSKILQTKEPAPERQNLARINFNHALDKLWSYNSRWPAISFADQLLQYYTMLSDDNFDPETSYIDFTTFLQNNDKKFGECSKNPFVIEYQLIKIYNDLTHFSDAVKGIVAPVPDMAMKIAKLHDALSDLSNLVETWKDQAPNNDYFLYLTFARSYCAAKALELQYTSNPDLPDIEKLTLSDAQQLFFQNALDALKAIESIKESAKEKANTATPGEVFSFGRSVLGNLPQEDLRSVQRHLQSVAFER